MARPCDLGDEQLVAATLAGDSRAFDELTARYRDSVFALAFRRLRRFEEARDVAQGALLSAYVKLPLLREPARFGAWLRQITKATALNTARDTRRELPADSVAVAERTAHWPDPVRLLQQSEVSGRLRTALATLPPVTRVALVLHYVSDYSYDEVARMLGLTAGAVKTRVSRARGLLRKELTEMIVEAAHLTLESRIGIALNMHGCPNRCRHCYVGTPHPAGLGEEQLRWTVEQFRAFRRLGTTDPLWSEVQVSTWVYEPDYSSDYKRLYELENELSGLPSLRPRHELLSVWRLARDPEYAEWAHSIGLRACQLTFFGMEEATDWGVRRKGAFRDLLVATERLLEAGIRPRWQLMFTKRVLPDLSALLQLAEDRRLRARSEALGGEFRLFMHCPSPDGEARHLEHLRPTLEDRNQVPQWLWYEGEDRTEAQLLPEWLKEDTPCARSWADMEGPMLFMMVQSNFDVYPNAGEMTEPWRLGNLKTDGLAVISDRLEHCETPGLQATFNVPVSELARRFGRPRSQRVYHPSDLKMLWVRMWADEAAGRQ